MNDKQRAALLDQAVAELKKTTAGYVPSGVHWRKAMVALEKLGNDLDPPHAAMPALGPIFKGGVSVLAHDLTHATSGIPLFPAFDDAFRQGTPIIAPENIEICRRLTSSNPGHAFFALGDSKLEYWFGHLDRDHPLGTKFKKGALVGIVGPHPGGGGPHCHLGVNAERILGKGREFVHHTNYTHGAPTIGAQLRKALP